MLRVSSIGMVQVSSRSSFVKGGSGGRHRAGVEGVPAASQHGHAGPNPVQLDLPPYLTVLAFTLGVTLVTALLFGAIPAFRASDIEFRHNRLWLHAAPPMCSPTLFTLQMSASVMGISSPNMDSKSQSQRLPLLIRRRSEFAPF